MELRLLGIVMARNCNGVDSLSMSASQELEPGTSRSWAKERQKMAQGLEVQRATRKALGDARAVGWGGSASG